MKIQQAEAWVGRTALDDEGTKFGKIAQVWVDDETGEPEWVTVKTGLFGSHESFVPLKGAAEADDDVRFAWDKGCVKDAPRLEQDGHLDVEGQARLFRHYGLTGPGDGPPSTTDGDGAVSAATGEVMTRSEEELRVGTVVHDAGRVRLRKVHCHRGAAHHGACPSRGGPGGAGGHRAAAPPALGGPVGSPGRHGPPRRGGRRHQGDRAQGAGPPGREVVTTDEAVSEDLRKKRVEADGRDGARRKA